MRKGGQKEDTADRNGSFCAEKAVTPVRNRSSYRTSASNVPVRTRPSRRTWTHIR